MSYQEGATLNIGALSMATGVPVETIRTWERRYGFPDSDRNDAGHRIYKLDTVEHLRLITEILSQGYRPSQLEGRSRDELEELLEKTSRDSNDGDQTGELCDEQWLDCWVQACTELDRRRFVRLLRSELSRMNSLAFLEERIAAFLSRLGEGWVSGELSIVHEHFAAECIRDFLVDRWRPLSKSAEGTKMVVATVSGERHCLGLHMVALVGAMADRRVVFLGADTPVEAIGGAVESSRAQEVALSISACTKSTAAINFSSKLREEIDSGVDIIVGGRGAAATVDGVEIIDDLRGLYDFLSTRSE